jgi:hypothetical protein
MKIAHMYFVLVFKDIQNSLVSKSEKAKMKIPKIYQKRLRQFIRTPPKIEGIPRR